MIFIKKYIKLLNSNFVKTSFQNSIQVLIKFIFGIANIKIIAIFVGPNGMALVSQLTNGLNLFANLSQLGFRNGIIKYTSEFQHSLHRQNIIIYSSVIVTVISSLIFGILTAIFSDFVAVNIFNLPEYVDIVRFSGIFFISIAIVNLYIAILNGQQKLKQYIFVNILLTISGFAISFTAVWFGGLHYLLWAQIFLPVICFVYILIKTIYRIKITNIIFSNKIIKKLSAYSLMTLISSLLVPLTAIIIRNIIVNDISWHAAGLWDGVNKISTNYIMLVTMSFSYYFLPAFSKIKSNNLIHQEIHNVYKILIPIVIVGGALLFLSKNLIINILFSDEFKGMSSLFIWQIIGDAFKILAWVIGFLFIAKAKVKLFIISEIISVVLQIILAKLFISINMEINIYYAVENIIYFVVMYGLFIVNFKNNLSIT